MRFNSTRSSDTFVNFERAVTDCMPQDGGLFIPSESPDLRRWILYTNEKTPFASIAGALTSACINEEFSPIICETIATRAFPFEPKLTKRNDRFFTLELYETPTGSHKDFGISYLVNCMETIFQLKGGSAVFLDVTVGELGASLARALRGKSYLKAVLLYPKGTPRGLAPNDYIWNGGNIYPLEIDGTEADCHALVREIFADRALVENYRLTVANTANIGRLMPQTFFYPYAFSRLKKDVHSDIYYAMAPGNYSNLVAGLYSWRLSLPVNGFICPTTDELILDMQGQCTVMDGMIPFAKRAGADPASPSNLERLEDVFHNNELMLKNLVFPMQVTDRQIDDACRALFMKYGIFADRLTASAYAAALNNRDLTDYDESVVVLVVRDHPALSADYIRHAVGEMPAMPANVAEALAPTDIGRPLAANARQSVISALESLR